MPLLLRGHVVVGLIVAAFVLGALVGNLVQRPSVVVPSYGYVKLPEQPMHSQASGSASAKPTGSVLPSVKPKRQRGSETLGAVPVEPEYRKALQTKGKKAETGQSSAFNDDSEQDSAFPLVDKWNAASVEQRLKARLQKWSPVSVKQQLFNEDEVAPAAAQVSRSASQISHDSGVKLGLGQMRSIYNCLYKIPLKDGIQGSMRGRTKMAAVVDLLIDALQFQGDIVEAGVASGGSSFTLLSFLGCTGLIQNRTFLLFDTWKGLPKSSDIHDGSFHEGQFLKSYDTFMSYAARYKEMYEKNVRRHKDDELAVPSSLTWDELWSHVKMHQGLFAETMPAALVGRDVVLLMCDGDMYASSMDCMSSAVPHVVKGGWIYNDDYYAFEANFAAVQDYRKMTRVDLKSPIYLIPTESHKGYIVEETCSSCSPPKGSGSRDAGRCLSNQCQGCFWQHLR